MNLLLSINGPNPEVNTWSDISTRTFVWSQTSFQSGGTKKKKLMKSLSHMAEFPTVERDCETFPPTTVNTQVQPSAFWGFQMWMRAPKTENSACNSADATTHRPSASVLRGSEACETSKKPGCWPQIAEMHRTGMTSKTPHSCIFPFTVNSLTWDYLFSLINNKLWCANCLGPCYKLKYILTPLRPSPAVSQGYMTRCLPGLKS